MNQISIQIFLRCINQKEMTVIPGWMNLRIITIPGHTYSTGNKKLVTSDVADTTISSSSLPGKAEGLGAADR